MFLTSSFNMISYKFKALSITLHLFKEQPEDGPTDWAETCKAIPLQALTGPEGSRGLRPLDCRTIGT
jgi:hypothetical protein